MTIDTRDRGCTNPGCWATWVDGAEMHECAAGVAADRYDSIEGVYPPRPAIEPDPEGAWQQLRDAGYSELELRWAGGDR